MAPSAGRPDYDQTLKRLLTRAHDGFLALLLPGARWLGERSPELPAVARQADLVWEVALADEERGLLHVELQTHHDPEIGERLAEYAIRLWRREHLPVRSVVVYLREAERLPDAPFVIGRGRGEEGLRYHYDVVRLWQQPPERILATSDAGLWPLAALMAGATGETITSVAERIARAPVPRAERDELISLLTALGGLRLSRPVVEQILRRSPMLRDLLKDSVTIEILRDEFREQFTAEGRAAGREEGRAAGREEGRAAGREEGRAEGGRQMIRTALESRFGQLEPAELAALQAADEPLLLALAAHVATDSREQMRARLGVQQ